MKFVALIEYNENADQMGTAGPRHHDYLHGLLDSGQLFAAGPFAEKAGALWVYEAETLEQAEDKVRDDPYNAAGVFSTWRIQPLAYWSARLHKGK